MRLGRGSPPLGASIRPIRTIVKCKGVLKVLVREKSRLHSKPPRLLPVPSVSFGDVFSNLPPVDDVGDVVGRPPLKHKRNFWRPTLLAKDRPDFQQIYVPSPRLVYGTNAIGGEHRKDVHGENLNHEMSNNDCYDAALKCFRDAIYPSNGVRQSSMKCLNLKTSDPGKCIDRKSA